MNQRVPIEPVNEAKVVQNYNSSYISHDDQTVSSLRLMSCSVVNHDKFNAKLIVNKSYSGKQSDEDFNLSCSLLARRRSAINRFYEVSW